MEMTSVAQSIPEEWDDVSVNDLKSAEDNALATGPFGSSIASRFFVREGVPVIRGSNLSNDGQIKFIDDGLVFISESKAAEFQRSTVRSGDLVFTCWGTINQVGLIGPHCSYNKYVISNKQMKLTPDRRKADSLFLYYAFSSAKIQNTILSQSIGSSIPGFNLGQLRSIRLHLPSLREQRAIAQALNDVDELLAAMHRLITKKRALELAAMQQLLTGQTRLPGFKGDWKPIRLGDSAVLKARIGWQGLTTAEYRTSGEFILVTGTEIRQGNVDWNSCFYVSSDRYDQDRNIQLLSGDVLVTKDGTIGKAAIVRSLPKPATLNSGIFVIRPIRQSFDSRFFFRILRSTIFIEFLNQLAAGSTINHLYQKDFVHFRFEVPPTLAEQEAIATIFDDMDEEIRSLEVRMAKTREIKLGMMQQLLTGKVRLA